MRSFRAFGTARSRKLFIRIATAMASLAVSTNTFAASIAITDPIGLTFNQNALMDVQGTKATAVGDNAYRITVYVTHPGGMPIWGSYGINCPAPDVYSWAISNVYAANASGVNFEMYAKITKSDGSLLVTSAVVTDSTN